MINNEEQRLIEIKKRFASMHRAEKKRVSDALIAEITLEVIKRTQEKKMNDGTSYIKNFKHLN
jgi:hypothetical protein